MHRTLTRGICVALFIGLAAPSAAAQLPPLPERPPLPEPVADAVADVGRETEAVVIPALLDAVEAGKPASNAVGFAARPGCVYGSTAALVVFGLAGLPVSGPTLTSPFSQFCASAFEEGPVDPVLYTLDDAVGPQFTGTTEPVLDQVNDAAIEPVRPEISGACLLLGLLGSPAVPPPVNRVNALHEVCYRE